MLPRLEIPILGEQDISAALIKRPAGYDNNVITLKWTCDHSKTTVRKSVPRNSCLIWLDNLCARRGVHTLAWYLVSWVVSSFRWISAAIIGFCHLRSLSQSPHDVDDDRYDFALAREILANPLYRGERRKTIYFSLRNESTRSRSATLGWDFFFFKRWVFFRNAPLEWNVRSQRRSWRRSWEDEVFTMFFERAFACNLWTLQYFTSRVELLPSVWR